MILGRHQQVLVNRLQMVVESVAVYLVEVSVDLEMVLGMVLNNLVVHVDVKHLNHQHVESLVVV
jgi:hypothetical protein